MLIFSCGIPQTEHDKILEEKSSLLEENSRLKKELQIYINGSEKLEANVLKFYKEKNYPLVKENIKLLKEYHPESKKIPEFNKYLARISKIEKDIIRKKELDKKESIRLANLSNTGIWDVGFYVDEFGESTKKGYIRTSLSGLFSNSATQNSNLNITFLISKSNDVDFQLYEYARNNPVKSYSSDRYRVLVKDKDGKKHKLIATNRSDRLSFGSSHSRIVHNVLKKGGRVMFSLYEIDTPTSQYEFTIINADYYENAYRILTKGK
jgi:hypothetical protein